MILQPNNDMDSVIQLYYVTALQCIYYAKQHTCKSFLLSEDFIHETYKYQIYIKDGSYNTCYS